MKLYKLPSLQSKVETIILANGEFPTHPIAIALLNRCEYLVCCDGGTNQLLQESTKTPDAIVGDCDSLSEEVKTRFHDIIHKVADQETNDLTKSVKYCIANGKKNITILGASGKREDHTLGNISLLAEYIDIEGVEIQTITNYGVFDAIKKDAEFESYIGQQVSVFSIENAMINSNGLKYPIHDRIFTNWWQGTLNEANSDVFQIKASGKVIVFRVF